jgi:hypothetical protein
MYSPKGFNGKLSIFFFFKCKHILFFSNSDRDFYSESNNVSQVRCDQLKNKSSRRVTYGNPCYSIGSKANSIYFLNDRSVYTYITKIQLKKKLKNATIVNALHFIGYYLSFVFPANLIWLLHCNAMHFDSFSLGARHLFQKLVLFFLCEVILVIHTLLFPE